MAAVRLFWRHSSRTQEIKLLERAEGNYLTEVSDGIELQRQLWFATCEEVIQKV